MGNRPVGGWNFGLVKPAGQEDGKFGTDTGQAGLGYHVDAPNIERPALSIGCVVGGGSWTCQNK